MTTRDRLYEKWILTPARRGHANVYSPVMGRQEFHAMIARHVLTWLRVSDSDAAFFSDSTKQRDEVGHAGTCPSVKPDCMTVLLSGRAHPSASAALR